MLREELQLLQEQGSLVGEVVKAMDKKKVLVKVKTIFFFLNNQFIIRYTKTYFRFIQKVNLLLILIKILIWQK